MKKLLCITGLLLFFVACEKSNNQDDSLGNELVGRFMGTFQRSGMDTSQVSIMFDSDNSFQGSSDKENYPAICRGTYSINGNKLTIHNGCAWTANFDWTLIFDGDYNFSFSGDNYLRIWKTNGAITDEYLLGRFIR